MRLLTNGHKYAIGEERDGFLCVGVHKKRLKLFALLFDGYGGETVMDFDIVQRLQFLLEHLIGEETIKQGRNSDFFADF